jgi:hypothetical protein
MANITVAELNDSMPTIVAAEALGYLKANTVLARLVRRVWDDQPRTKGQVIKIPFTGALVASDKAANTVVTLQAAADTAVSLTLNKHKETSFLIEDPGKVFATPDYLTAYIQDGMKVIAEAIDGDIAALYAGFSQTIDATLGLGEDDAREARRLLNAAKAPLADRSLVLHEDAEFEMLGIERVVNRDYAEALGAAAANAFITRFAGFNVFLDQKIAVAGGQCKNLAFHRDAIAIASAPLPQAPAGLGVNQAVMNEDGIGLRVTTSYSPDHLGMQATIDVLYGVTELRDNHGVAISTDEI